VSATAVDARGPAPGAGPSRRSRRRLALWAAGLLALLVATLLGGPPTTDDDLDPRSTAPGGLHGLLALAEEMGGQVDISTDLPADVSTRVLVPRDGLTARQRDALEAFVEGGGVAVVADPASPLHELEPGGGLMTDLVGARGQAPRCDLQALADVNQVLHASWQTFVVAEGGTPCFPVNDDEAWLVVQPRGEGRLVSLGSAGPLVNGALDRADNPVLAAALLFPEPGSSMLVLEGETDAPATMLDDLVPPRVWHGLALLLLSSVVAVLAVARRLGRPVEERLPPTVPTAELTRSIGDLLQRGGRRDAAAERLRRRARDDLGRQVGSDLPPEALVERAVARLGLDHDEAARALLDHPVRDDDGLVAVAAAVARLRERMRSPS
jgi:hypothetical protein